ncbi:MAG: HAMP domain-containing sensor histidine kinase [Phaeodactylibacter sp.]|uniref:sensor histidine kinase n=1 Tax=Phaeodactylibacter sp. TaxID=1940289 RepID=UPI0032ECA4E0
MNIKAQNQKMLSIIYQIPVGLVQTDATGGVQEMNAMAIQFLMPHFVAAGLTGENLFDLLRALFPKAIEAIKAYPKPSGNIIQQERFKVSQQDGNDNASQHFILTINRLSEENYLFIIDDITELYTKEQELFQIQQEHAVERGKFEVISGVLHDIGNAVVGFGAYLTKVKQLNSNSDTLMLKKLAQFIEANQSDLAVGIGAPKAGAMLSLVNALREEQEEHLKKMETAITDQMNIVTHVKDILNIQRQYLKVDNNERTLVSLRSIVGDALAMQLATLEKRNIAIQTYLPDGLPPIKGDRTKLMQVFLNLIKNSIESIDQKGGDNHQLILRLEQDQQAIIATVQDTGIGIPPEEKGKLFQRGFTTKNIGSGLGLNGSQSILAAHNATIDIDSPGAGQGAKVTIKYPLPKP